MPPGTAPVTAMPTPTAQPTVAKPHDIMKTIDGMFKGCVIRMGLAFKDPKVYGESTRLIISECTKKYQDALDDCEIQILDAKWYLESKLAENKARREAKEKEANAATAKRKHEEATEKDQEMSTDSPSKRVKGEPPSPNTAAVQHLSDTKGTTSPIHSRPNTPSQPAQISRPGMQLPKPLQTTSVKVEEKRATTPQPPAPSQPIKAEQSTSSKADPDSAPADEFPKPTPNVTPAITNDEFTFESMFTDALGDDDENNDDNLNIGLDDDPFGDDFNTDPFVNDTSTSLTTQSQAPTQTQPQPPPQKNPQSQAQPQPTQPDNAFSALLEGVEQFANQPDDSQKPNNTNLATNNNNNNAFTNDLDMGTNIFDSFLNDEFDVGSNNGGDFGDYGEGGGDVNFDELFGDGS